MDEIHKIWLMTKCQNTMLTSWTNRFQSKMFNWIWNRVKTKPAMWEINQFSNSRRGSKREWWKRIVTMETIDPNKLNQWWNKKWRQRCTASTYWLLQTNKFWVCCKHGSFEFRTFAETMTPKNLNWRRSGDPSQWLTVLEGTLPNFSQFRSRFELNDGKWPTTADTTIAHEVDGSRNADWT
jgi:hypothetical protein